MAKKNIEKILNKNSKKFITDYNNRYKPFNLGKTISLEDRILINLDEGGGTILGEEKSRRTIMVPNSIISEEEVVNYTHADNYILDEITTSITYESNLEKAEKIMKPLWEFFLKRIEKKPYTRLKFKDSGIDITVRYNSIAKERNKISTNITREIFNSIRKNKDVEIAYPHTEVVFREKT